MSDKPTVGLCGLVSTIVKHLKQRVWVEGKGPSFKTYRSIFTQVKVC